MEHEKISKLLNDSNTVTRKQIEVNDLLVGQHSINKNMRFKYSILISDLCDYSNLYVAVNRAVTVKVIADTNRKSKKLIFKNNALFRSCTLIGNAEDLDIVMDMYNFLECRDNCSIT